MDSKKREALINMGVNFDDALHRFLGMEDMYEKFLKQYAEEDSIGAMKTALENSDVVAIFKAAHSMKGLAGNLGLDCIYKTASEVTELTRGKESTREVDMDAVARGVDTLEVADRDLSAVILKM